MKNRKRFLVVVQQQRGSERAIEHALVMGSVAQARIPGLLIGSTAESVLGDINCSVLTVKPDGFISPVALDDVQPAPSPRVQAVAGS